MTLSTTSIQAVDYQRCLITYLDVLGTRQFLNESSASTSRRTHIHSLLSILIRETSDRRRSKLPLELVPKSRVFVRTFSDLVVRFTPLPPTTPSLSTVISEEVWSLC